MIIKWFKFPIIFIVIAVLVGWGSAAVNGGASKINYEYNIVVSEARQLDWATHDVGNCWLTITRYGAIGFMSQAGTQGDGFLYPSAGPNHLFYSGFAAGNDSSYCVDRYFGPVNDDTDWETTIIPDGSVYMYEPGPNNIDEYATARYDDSGHPAAKGLLCLQYSWAWDDTGAEDFVIMKFSLINEGTETLTDLYAAVFMDWDVGSYMNNQGSSEAARNLTWMYETTPYVGVAILDPPRTTPAANLALIDHTVYVYPAGLPNDSIKIQFMDGTIQNPSSGAPYDWSTCNSAGPFTLGPGESAVAAFAIIGGDDLSDLEANADTAYERYWNWPGVEEMTDLRELSALVHSYPNPMHLETEIMYQLPNRSKVSLKIYDFTGQLIRTLVNEDKNAGHHKAVWDSKDDSGAALPSGVYFYRLETESYTANEKLVLLK